MSFEDRVTPGLAETNHFGPPTGGLGFEIKDILYSRLGLSMTVFVYSLVVGLAFQPPFLITKPQDPLDEPKFSHRNNVILAILLSVLVVFLPWFSTRSKQLNIQA